MPYLKDFQALILSRDYPAFLRLWDEYCVGEEVEENELKMVLMAIKRSEFAEPFGKYVEKIIPLWEKLPEGNEKHEIFRLIIDLQTTNHEALYQYVSRYLERKYGNDPTYGEKLRLIGFRNKDRFQRSVSNFELVNHMKKGNYVFHTGGWGVGQITDVSILREEATIEFEYVSDEKNISLTSAFNMLIPLDKGHFWARRFGDFEELKKEAKTNPIAVFRSLLKDLGPKTASEIKEELYEWVISKKEWAKWWQNVRTRIKRDTQIELPDKQSPFFFFKQDGSLHENRLRKSLEGVSEVKDLVSVIHGFVRDVPETFQNPDFKFFIQDCLRKELNKLDLSEGASLELNLLLEELLDEKASDCIEKILARSQDLPNSIQSIQIVTFKKKLLMRIRKHRADWQKIFLDLILQVEENPIRDYLLDELLPGPSRELLVGKIKELLEAPTRFPKAFVWYFKKLMVREDLPFADREGKGAFFETFFILLHHLESEPALRDLGKKMQLILTKGRYFLPRTLFKEMSLEAVGEVLLLISKCYSFSEHDLKIFQSLAEVVHPSLDKMRKKQKNVVDPEVIWTTSEGYAKVKKRIEMIGTVETVKNSEEIKEARSHGDLRENPAFKAALERQGHLQTELKMLSDQMNAARLLSKGDVNSDEVGIGCVVECRTSRGKYRIYTILGPWDADPERGIVSLQSKIAQVMKGLTVNDKFQFQGEEYIVTKISSYFDS